MSSVFVVAATVLAIVNGQPVHPFDDGDTRYDVGHRFPTMEACEHYHHSDAYGVQEQALNALVLGALGTSKTDRITITAACHEFAPGPDGVMKDKTAEQSSF